MNFKYYADLYLKLGRSVWKFSTFCKNEGIVNNRLSFFFDKEIEKISLLSKELNENLSTYIKMYGVEAFKQN